MTTIIYLNAQGLVIHMLSMSHANGYTYSVWKMAVYLVTERQGKNNKGKFFTGIA